MLVKVFEVKNENVNLEDDIDNQIIEMLRKFGEDLEIKKVNALDEDEMKNHPEVRKYIDENGIESLPVAKVKDELMAFNQLEPFLEENLG